MDFKLVTEKLSTAFSQNKVQYALIGGYAVSLWGLPRATVDLDFLVRRDDMGKVREIAESLGYYCIHTSENVTQFDALDNALGEVDFLHAFRPASLAMLERAELKIVFNGQQPVPVILPEDLIGLKVQAIANKPSRMAIDKADIEGLMQIYGDQLDWQRVGDYFALFEMTTLYLELKGRYHAH
jgi:hypothetical protein